MRQVGHLAPEQCGLAGLGFRGDREAHIPRAMWLRLSLRQTTSAQELGKISSLSVSAPEAAAVAEELRFQGLSLEQLSSLAAMKG